MTRRIPLQPCGTNAAWQRHDLNGEEPDQACIDAHQASQRMYQARYNEAKSPAQSPAGTPPDGSTETEGATA